MRRSSHRPADPTIWYGALYGARWRQRVNRKIAARDAIEAADPLWWASGDPLTLRAASWQRDARLRHPSMVRQRMGVRVATGPGRLP